MNKATGGGASTALRLIDPSGAGSDLDGRFWYAQQGDFPSTRDIRKHRQSSQESSDEEDASPVSSRARQNDGAAERPFRKGGVNESIILSTPSSNGIAPR